MLHNIFKILHFIVRFSYPVMQSHHYLATFIIIWPYFVGIFLVISQFFFTKILKVAYTSNIIYMQFIMFIFCTEIFILLTGMYNMF